jgi:putative NADH-flavin reductase
VVGGAGSLFVNPEHTSTLELQPDFPADAYKPVSAAHGSALAILRAAKDTLTGPMFHRLLTFRLMVKRPASICWAAKNSCLTIASKSVISYADYAVAMVDEIEKGSHVQQRISVVEA